MLRAAPGAEFEAYTSGFATGLVGTIGVRVRDGQGADAIAHTTAGIAEDIASSGIYRATLTAPELAGQFWVVFDNGSGVYSEPEQLVVTSDALALPAPGGRDLCTIADVKRYIPGYVENDDTEATLQALVTAESRSIHGQTSREFVAIAGANPRIFDLPAATCVRRRLRIGDAAQVTSLELFDVDGSTSLGVVDASLYVLEPRIREEWEPHRLIAFPHRPGSVGPVQLAPGRSLHVTGTWGFPEIPPDIREACAKLVVVRYFADTAQAGTDLSDAIDPTFNVGGLLRSALEAVESYSDPGFA